jgi:hypothetical protein
MHYDPMEIRHNGLRGFYKDMVSDARGKAAIIETPAGAKTGESAMTIRS